MSSFLDLGASSHDVALPWDVMERWQKTQRRDGRSARWGIRKPIVS